MLSAATLPWPVAIVWKKKKKCDTISAAAAAAGKRKKKCIGLNREYKTN
jgi:hypothetical protein